MTVTQALAHPWFEEVLQGEKRRLDERFRLESLRVIERLKLFSTQSRLQREFLLMLVHLSDPREFKENMRAFQAIDTDNSGMISAAEFVCAIKEFNLYKEGTVTPEDINRIIKKVDFDRD